MIEAMEGSIGQVSEEILTSKRAVEAEESVNRWILPNGRGATGNKSHLDQGR